MLIWVNVHGGFLLGLVLLALFWAGSLWAWLHLKESRIEEAFTKIRAGKRVRDLTLAGLASTAATLLNPYGWRLHGHIYSYLSNRFFMDHIEEFQSPNFHGIGLKCFLLLLLIAIAALAANGRRLPASGILVVLFAYRPSTTWPGLVIVLLGIPIYLVIRNTGSLRTSPSDGSKAVELQSADEI